ncbi:MAG: uroporphyrinogen decarboxylase family protein [Deltaproteobacteria bacterium]|nr:uroporphyrinogen decarboxylase family protein [Deltaproteobacteria bacterium]
MSSLKQQQTNHIPVTVIIGPYCAGLAGYSVREILTDARKSAEAHLAFYDRFQPDSVIVYNDIFLEAEAIGCELNFPEDNISHPKAPILSKPSRLAHLKVPDPKKDGRIPYFFEVCERVSTGLSGRANMGLGHSGPWNIAMHARGAEQLLIDTLTDPEFVHQLMRFSTEVVRAMGDALLEAGRYPSLSEASASCSLISPKLYREFIKPYHKELRDHFRDKGAPMSLHVCGYIDPIMEDIVETGIDFISLDAQSSLEKMIEVSGGKLAIMGNVPTAYFADASRGQMEAAIDNCVETAAGGGRFILSSGCEIPLNSTEDRIDHFFEYGRKSSHKQQ